MVWEGLGFKLISSAKKMNEYIKNIWIYDLNNHLVEDKQLWLTSYPGITPEIVIPLEGHLEYYYNGQSFRSKNGILFSFLHHSIKNNFATSPKFVVISFKGNAIASLLPFMTIKPIDLIKNPIVPLEYIFDKSILLLQKKLRKIKDNELIIGELMHYFHEIFNPNNAGFVSDLVGELGKDMTIKSILKATNYSYSTIERRFKAETGLTPKKYLILKRFKTALAKIVDSKNTDWMQYVADLGYHDQSHFNKEIYRFTNLTPSQLLTQQNFLDYRPDLDFLTNFYNEPK